MKSIFSFFTACLALTATCAANIQVVGSLARTKSVKAGELFEGVIQLKNTGSKPAHVNVRQTDYHFEADGSNRYDEPGSSPRSNANWLSVTPPRIVLEANQSTEVHYKCRVPDRPELRGAYWSMIMIEPAAAPVAAADDKQGTVGLRTMTRFGIQIVTEVGEGSQSIKVLQKKLVRDGAGSHKLELDIANTGERALHPSISVELYNDKGVPAGRFDAGKTRIYPSCSIRATAALTGVPPGKYTALVLLDSGDANVMGAQYSLQIDAQE